MDVPGHRSPRVRAFLAVFAALCFVALAIQFLRPPLPNPPVTSDLAAPPQVEQILRASCYNCHSNETKLSWFDWPAPAYWLVVRDVRQARRRLNFSEIGALPAAQRNGLLFESLSQIELGAMPLPDYKRLHPESAVSAEQIAILKDYLRPLEPAQPPLPNIAAAADAQYNQWIAERAQRAVDQTGAPATAPAPNGIAFLSDYKNWQAISSTDRADNFTVREILGNDVAVKAIAENHIAPWPDGVAFAKVAWYEQPDAAGIVRAGPFFQVEFMIRDSKKYADTLGWGWARWRGADLKPYGQDASFTQECVGCHSPLAKTNYVFTEPILAQSLGEAMPGHNMGH